MMTKKVIPPIHLHTQRFQHFVFSSTQFEAFEKEGNVVLEEVYRSLLVKECNAFIRIQNREKNFVNYSELNSYLDKILKKFLNLSLDLEEAKNNVLTDPIIQNAWSFINHDIFDEVQHQERFVPTDYLTSPINQHVRSIKKLKTELKLKHGGSKGRSPDIAFNYLISEIAYIFQAAGGKINIVYNGASECYTGDFIKFLEAIHFALPKSNQAHSADALNQRAKRMNDVGKLNNFPDKFLQDLDLDDFYSN